MKIWACKVCGESLRWGKSSKGNWMPVEVKGGGNHLAKCRPPLPTGTPMRSEAIYRPSKYGPIPEPCCPEVPPWELCEHQINGTAEVLSCTATADTT